MKKIEKYPQCIHCGVRPELGTCRVPHGSTERVSYLLKCPSCESETVGFSIEEALGNWRSMNRPLPPSASQYAPSRELTTDALVNVALAQLEISAMRAINAIDHSFDEEVTFGPDEFVEIMRAYGIEPKFPQIRNSRMKSP